MSIQVLVEGPRHRVMIDMGATTCHATPRRVTFSRDQILSTGEPKHPAPTPTPPPPDNEGSAAGRQKDKHQESHSHWRGRNFFFFLKKMSSLRPFHALDLFRFNLTNLDVLTENYDPSFYLQYLAKWPTLCSVMESSRGRIMGYSRFTSGGFFYCCRRTVPPRD